MAADDEQLARMSDYERRAWNESLKRLQREPRQVPLPSSIKSLARQTRSRAAGFADSYLPTDKAIEIATKAMDGTFSTTFVPALRSANAQRTIRGYGKTHEGIVDLAGLQELDLKELDRFKRHKQAYVTTAAVQGGTTALFTTGAEVATTVSAGTTAGAVIFAVAADAVASLALMGRAIGSVAVRYGYDVKLPEEELYAMSALSLGTASTAQAKFAAFGSLSRLTQQMMRQATWQELNEVVLVRVIRRMYETLGIRLTQRKLAQTVPFVGIAINGGLSAYMASSVYERAELVYRLRFLSEKYDLDPNQWLPDEIDPNEIEPGPAGLDALELIEQEEHAVGKAGLDSAEG